MLRRRRAAALVAVAVVAATAGCLGPAGDDASAGDATSPADGDTEIPVTATFTDGDERLVTLDLVVADTPAERGRGLMDRDEIPEDGMVFVYPGEAERTFWMKNTRIPLDMIFVAANGTVVDVVQADVPPPGRSDAALQRYRGGPAQYVVEVARGTANAAGIAPGANASFAPRPAASG